MRSISPYKATFKSHLIMDEGDVTVQEALVPDNGVQFLFQPIGAKGEPGEGADPAFIQQTIDRLSELEINGVKSVSFVQAVVANSPVVLTATGKIKFISVFNPDLNETYSVDFTTNANQTEATFKVMWNINNAEIEVFYV